MLNFFLFFTHCSFLYLYLDFFFFFLDALGQDSHLGKELARGGNRVENWVSVEGRLDVVEVRSVKVGWRRWSRMRSRSVRMRRRWRSMMRRWKEARWWSLARCRKRRR